MDDLPRVFVFGETHTNPLHHRAQLKLISAVRKAHDADMKHSQAPLAVGLEMFYRQQQYLLDQFVFGGGSLEALRRDTAWDLTWGFEFNDYCKIFQYCKLHGVRLVGLNVPSGVVRLVTAQGLGGLPRELGPYIPKVDLEDTAHRARFVERMGAVGHGDGPYRITGEKLQHYYEAFAMWDDYMADTAATYLRSAGPDARLVVLAGVTHVEERNGLPDRLARRLPAGAPPVFTVCADGVGWDARSGLPQIERPPGREVADWVWYTENSLPPQSTAEQSRLSRAARRRLFRRRAGGFGDGTGVAVDRSVDGVSSRT